MRQSEFIKTAARGDQLVKHLGSLLTRATHGNIDNAAGAVSRLQRAIDSAGPLARNSGGRAIRPMGAYTRGYEGIHKLVNSARDPLGRGSFKPDIPAIFGRGNSRYLKSIESGSRNAAQYESGLHNLDDLMQFTSGAKYGLKASTRF